LNIAGLNIEGQRVKASFVQSRLGLGAKQLEEDSIVDLPLHAADRTSTLKEALEQWRDDYGIKGVVVGLGLSDFSHHFIDLPVSSKADAAGALVFELEKYLPLAPDEYQYDFHYLGQSPDREGSRVLVLAIRKDRLRWIEQAVTESGLKFLAVRCLDIEIVNEFLRNESVRDVILITQADNGFNVMGIGEKGPTSLKTLPPQELLQREVSSLADIYDGGIFIAGANEHEVLKDLPAKTLEISMSSLTNVSPLRRPTVNMNFLSGRLRPRQVDYFTYTAASLAGLCILLFFMTSLLAYYKDSSSLSHITRRINEIKSTSSSLVETRREIEASNAKLAFLHEFQLERNRHIAILNEVSITLPKNAWLTSYLSDEKGTVELEGYARSSAAIIAPFENSAMFKDVEFTSPVTVRDGRERFSIKMQVVK